MNEHLVAFLEASPPSADVEPIVRVEVSEQLNSGTTATEARWLHKQGFQPVRLDSGTKAPRAKGWNTPEGRFDPERGDIDATFAGPCNLGVETGEVSRGLVDVDVDCSEAVAVAPAFLPPTEMAWGRHG
jgi:hypothetical protein